jgi:hypothetical protein
MVRVATLMILNGKHVFGAGGAALLRFLGGETASIALLLTGLTIWIVAPLFVATRILKHQDI